VGSEIAMGSDEAERPPDHAESPKAGRTCCFQRLNGNKADVRLHLVGHSAGAIIHALPGRLAGSRKGWKIESLSLLAPRLPYRPVHSAPPAAPAIRGKSRAWAEFHLSDPVEDNEGRGCALRSDTSARCST